LKWQRIVYEAVTKEKGWTVPSPENPTGMVQKRKRGAFPMNIFVSAQVSGIKGMPLLPALTGQNQVQAN